MIDDADSDGLEWLELDNGWMIDWWWLMNDFFGLEFVVWSSLDRKILEEVELVFKVEDEIEISVPWKIEEIFFWSQILVLQFFFVDKIWMFKIAFSFQRIIFISYHFSEKAESIWESD